MLWAAPEDRTGPGWRAEICLLFGCVVGSATGGELPVLGGVGAETCSLRLQLLRAASKHLEMSVLSPVLPAALIQDQHPGCLRPVCGGGRGSPRGL